MTINRGHSYEEQLDRSAAGQSLLEFLAQRYPHSTREEWSQRIDAGRVLLDGRSAAADSQLSAGQRLTWQRPGWIEPEAPRGFAVLFEDDELLAVAKPSGLPTLPGGGFLEKTLLHQLREYAPDAAPLHRLGRFTSGIVLCGKASTAAAALIASWNDGDIVKQYRALATGRPEQERFRIEQPIGPVPYPPLGTLHAALNGGKPACSQVRVLEQYDDRFLSDVRIDTGRPHQIRIHLAAAGHPLVGDPLYVRGGLPAADGKALPGDGGYLLHASELVFTHPRSSERITIRCAPPPALRRVGATSRP